MQYTTIEKTVAKGMVLPVFLVVLLLLTGAWGGDALAALGVHDIVGGGGEGSCAGCHNQAAAAAATRGWGRSFSNVPTTGWFSQPITVLCYTCHQSGGGGVGASDMTNYAMSLTNHYCNIPNAPAGVRDPTIHDNQTMTTSGLPYSQSGAIQCTSCHNVHNNMYRPYLARASMSGLCDACHPDRYFAAVGAANIGLGGDNVSVHPVSIPMADNASNGPTSLKTVGQMDVRLKNNNNPAPAANGWVLGGKLTEFNTGNIGCETCHTVHGSATVNGVDDLLSINNRSTEASSPSSPLCEGCHLGGAAGGSVGSPATVDHPLDNGIGTAFYPAGTAIPTEWQRAVSGRLDRGASVFTTAGGVTGTPRCSSCHDAHGGQGGRSLLRSPVPATAGGEWCYSCHVGTATAPNAHHSARGLEGGTFVSSITCSQCHGGGFVGHNGFFSSFVLPAGNFTTARGRSIAPTDVKNNVDSALCLYCHRDDEPISWRTVYGYAENTVMTPYVSPGTAVYPRLYGTKRGSDSHSLEKDANLFPGVALKADTWVVGRSVFSKYGSTPGGGGTAPGPITANSTMICESCHSVLYNDGISNPGSYTNASRAGWESNLLLLPYKDDPPGTGNRSNEYAVESELCLGCHAEPGYHHPLTGDIVTLTGLALVTGSGSLANQTAAPIGGGDAPGTLSYPGGNRMDCDSCHRPHAASAESSVTGATGRTDGRFHYLLEVDGSGNVWSPTLCAECHPQSQ